MIADQQSLGQENVDAVFSVLYDTLNCQQSYIRIGQESKLGKSCYKQTFEAELGGYS